METGKTGKYFKYAIGEIILVVIGILIALSINNWNNNRLNYIKETNYIKNIERDLNNQLQAIDAQTNFETKVKKYSKIALKPFNDNNELKIDSTLAVALGVMASRRTFVNTNPTYTELISSGNIELIKTESFKNELINYYQELERIEKIIGLNNNLYTDQEFIPVMIRLGVSDGIENYKNVSQSYRNNIETTNPLTSENLKHLMKLSEKLLKNEDNQLLFINHLARRQGYAHFQISILKEFREKTEQLLESIKDY